MSILRHPTAHRRTDQRQGDGLAGSGEPPYDGGMEARVAKLEADLTAIKVDLAVIKANGSTKSDIAELRAATKVDLADLGKAIAESQTKIIGWVVVAIFLAQLLPMVKEWVKPATQVAAPPISAPQAPAPAQPPAK